MLNLTMLDELRHNGAQAKGLTKPLSFRCILVGGLLFAGLYAAGQYSFLLFHTLAEIFSIIVACAVAMLAWNSRRYMDSTYVPFIAIALGCVASIDLLHLLSYKGLNIFHGITANRPTQLWIAGRYLYSLSFVVATLAVGRSLNYKVILMGYLLVTLLILAAIIHWEIFPDCFIEGAGLTRFKIGSEYLISAIFGLAIYLLLKKRSAFHPDVLRLLIFSLMAAILTEIAFTFYVRVYDLSNMVGHFLKIFSFYMIYKAVVQTGLISPYDFMFLSLKKKEASLIQARDQLEIRVAERTAELVSTNDHLRKSNRALRVLTDCHQALIHDRDERKLMDDICRIIVKAGGYCFAWAGFVAPRGADMVIPIAHQGYEAGYLDALNDSGMGDRAEKGIPGGAVASGEAVVNNDIFSQTPHVHQHSEAVSRGYGASISLPLRTGNRMMGELNIYSATPHAFDDSEVKLLVELADDLSFSIAAIRSRAKREWALEERDKLLFLIEQSTDLVSIISLDGELLYLNRAGRMMLEIEHLDEVRGAITLNKILRSEMAVLNREILPDLKDKRHWQGELELHRMRTEEPITSDVNLFTIIEPKEERPVAYATVCRDIGQRKKMEAQLMQSHKMEAIGVLAGGIAHDFNNILAAISGFAELALCDVEEGSLQEENLQEVVTAGDRAKELVKQILTFSRHAEEERLPTQIGLYVKEALKLLRASLPSTIEIRQDISSRALVWSDATQIHQVVMNLCTNASHAMQKTGGYLDVRLADIDLEACPLAQRTKLAPGPYVQMTIGDSGCGMSAELLERVFEPFYTTKAEGEGTGMGLSVVHGIVNSHDGAITVDSRPGRGTTFDIYWPIADSRAVPESPPEPESPAGTENVLFIDDEEMLTVMGRQLLESLGYEVVTHTSSVAALEAFKADPQRFDVVITDMTMPDMAGDELAEEMIGLRPDIPIIVYTGYSKRIDEQTAESIGIRALLPKPIRKADIARAIRAAIDNRPLDDSI